MIRWFDAQSVAFKTDVQNQGVIDGPELVGIWDKSEAVVHAVVDATQDLSDLYDALDAGPDNAEPTHALTARQEQQASAALQNLKGLLASKVADVAGTAEDILNSSYPGASFAEWEAALSADEAATNKRNTQMNNDLANIKTSAQSVYGITNLSTALIPSAPFSGSDDVNQYIYTSLQDLQTGFADFMSFLANIRNTGRYVIDAHKDGATASQIEYAENQNGDYFNQFIQNASTEFATDLNALCFGIDQGLQVVENNLAAFEEQSSVLAAIGIISSLLGGLGGIGFAVNDFAKGAFSNLENSIGTISDILSNAGISAGLIRTIMGKDGNPTSKFTPPDVSPTFNVGTLSDLAKALSSPAFQDDQALQATSGTFNSLGNTLQTLFFAEGSGFGNQVINSDNAPGPGQYTNPPSWLTDNVWNAIYNHYDSADGMNVGGAGNANILGSEGTSIFLQAPIQSGAMDTFFSASPIYSYSGRADQVKYISSFNIQEISVPN